MAFNFFKPKYLPETYTFELEGNIPHDISFVSKILRENKFIALSSGVIVPTNGDFEQHPNETLRIDTADRGNYQFLFEYQKNYLFSNRKEFLGFFERCCSIGLEWNLKDIKNVAHGKWNDGIMAKSLPIALSSSNQMYFPEIVRANQYENRDKGLGHIQAHRNYIENLLKEAS